MLSSYATSCAASPGRSDTLPLPPDGPWSRSGLPRPKTLRARSSRSLPAPLWLILFLEQQSSSFSGFGAGAGAVGNAETGSCCRNRSVLRG